MSPGFAGGRAVPAIAPVEDVVIEALRAALPDVSVGVSRDSEVLRLVDSLGLVTVLGNVQAALTITLKPKEVIQVLRARSVADVALVLTTALSARSTSIA